MYLIFFSYILKKVSICCARLSISLPVILLVDVISLVLKRILIYLIHLMIILIAQLSLFLCMMFRYWSSSLHSKLRYYCFFLLLFWASFSPRATLTHAWILPTNWSINYFATFESRLVSCPIIVFKPVSKLARRTQHIQRHLTLLWAPEQ